METQLEILDILKTTGTIDEMLKTARHVSGNWQNNEHIKEVINQIKRYSDEFIQDNYRLFGVLKDTPSPQIGFSCPSAYISREGRIGIDFTSQLPIENAIGAIYHETAHYLHHLVSPKMWFTEEEPKPVRRNKKIIIELVAEMTTLRNFNKSSKFKSHIKNEVSISYFGEEILRIYDKLTKSLPIIISSKTIEDIFANAPINEIFWGEINKAYEDTLKRKYPLAYK